MPLISIVMPTHNKREDSLLCAREVIRQAENLRNCELIVVDDGSKDGTCDSFGRFDPGSVPFTYLRLAGSGPAVARNTGIASARGEIVVMVDDDAVPQDGWLAALLAPFDRPEVVGVEGMVLPVGGEAWGPMGMSPSNLSGGVYLTCNCAYRRIDLLAVGGFDEGFRYPAFEDTDLAMQMLARGEVIWSPKSVVHHPRRRWSLQRAMRELKFNEALLRFTRRYKCLGWTDRPTKHPRIRILFASVFTLPIGRIFSALSKLRSHPLESLRFISICLLQAFAAVVVVPRCFLLADTKSPSRVPLTARGPVA